jgi:hypothetical protein
MTYLTCPEESSAEIALKFLQDLVLISFYHLCLGILSSYCRQNFPTKILYARCVVIYDAIISIHVIVFYFVTIIFI